MTLGAAAAAGVRLIVWCKECRHQVEPDPAEMATRYGAETSVLDWRERLVVFPVRQPAGRHGAHRDETIAADNFEVAAKSRGPIREAIGAGPVSVNPGPQLDRAITER